MSNPFQGKTFTAPAKRLDRLTKVLISHVPPNSDVRILDLGCGTGEQLFRLSSQFPNASFVGVDVSENNIAAAKDDPRYAGIQSAMSFCSADYFDAELDQFDVIIADSVLHNIDIPDELLTAKLSGSLRPGGILIVTMPCDGLYNRVLWILRRGARRLRGPWLDRAFLRLGRFMHPDWEPGLVRERIPYMYLLPHRIDDAGFRKALTVNTGLELVDEVRLRRESVAQPVHRLTVYRKGGQGL